jgi:Protein of unknown function (DUF3352)
LTRRLAGICALFAFAFAFAGCGGTTSIGTGASDLVPASAAAFIAVDTDPGSSQWQTVDALASKFPDKQKGIDELKGSLRKDKLDWDKDFKPALGKEVDFVWLDFENNGDNFVALMQPKDDGAFKRLVAKGNATEKDPSQRIVYEKFKDWEVLAQTQAMIDRFEQASESSARALSDEPAFTHAMDRLGSDAVARGYVRGDVLMTLARKYGGSEAKPYLDKAGTLDWIAMRLGANSDGIGLDTIAHGTPGKLFKGLPRTPSFNAKLPESVPQNALVYLTFHGSKNMLSGLEKNSLFDNPNYRQFAGPLRDLASLLEGENAFYLRPGSGHSVDVPFEIPELTFVAAGAKRDGAAVIDKLLDREFGTSPEFATIAGVKVHKLASGGVGLYYANVDGKLVVTDLPAGIKGVKNAGRPLSESEAYRDAADASGLPSKTQGFLYVDIRSTVPLVEKLSQAQVPAEIGRNLKPLRSAVEYAVARSHELQVSFFLRIK